MRCKLLTGILIASSILTISYFNFINKKKCDDNCSCDKCINNSRESIIQLLDINSLSTCINDTNINANTQKTQKSITQSQHKLIKKIKSIRNNLFKLKNKNKLNDTVIN